MLLFLTVPLNTNKTETTTTTSTTTEKPTPCEIATKKPNDKSEEKSDEKKEETTKKPKSKSSRRRRRNVRNPSVGYKRCIADLFGGFKRDSILAASNPNAAEDCDRYDSELASSNVQSKTVEGDNQAEESMLQAIPTRKQLFGGNLLGEPLSLFKKLSPSSKTENLLHGNVPSSETSEVVAVTSENVESPPELSIPITNEPFAPPQFSKYEPVTYEPSDYLPSFEYFPKNPVPSRYNPQAPSQPSPQVPSQNQNSVVVGPSSFKSSPIYEHHGQQHDMSLPSHSINQPQLPQNSLPSHDKPFNIGPSSFKSSPLYNHLGSEQEITHTTKRYSDKSEPSGCRCDPEHFDDLLHHMQSSYAQFHNGMTQLFDTFKSQTNCGSKISDSSSSNSNFDYNVRCHDKNVVNADPELSNLCQKAFAEGSVDPSGGYYKPPGAGEIKTGGFKNQFLSYADYIKMIQNVNANPGTVLSSTKFIEDDDDDDDLVSASQRLQDDSHESIVDKLRQHFEQYQNPAEVVAAPEPEPPAQEPEPQVAAPENMPENQSGPLKAPLEFRSIKSLLPEWKPRIKI